MAFYDEMAAMASEMLSEFGKVMQVRSEAVISSDPVAGTVTTAAPVNTPVNGVVVAINENNAPGALIEQGDRLAILDGAITIRDTLVDGSNSWRVVDVVPVQPADVGIVWRAQVRK